MFLCLRMHEGFLGGFVKCLPSPQRGTGGTPNRLPWVLAVQKTVVHQAFPVLEPLTPVTGFRGPGPVDFPCCPSERDLRTLQWGDDSRPPAFDPRSFLAVRQIVGQRGLWAGSRWALGLHRPSGLGEHRCPAAPPSGSLSTFLRGSGMASPPPAAWVPLEHSVPVRVTFRKYLITLAFL